MVLEWVRCLIQPQLVIVSNKKKKARAIINQLSKYKQLFFFILLLKVQI